MPHLGVVYQPAIDRLWAGLVGARRFARGRRRANATSTAARWASSGPRSRPSRTSTSRPPIISAEAIGLCDHVSVGSSLKFCIVAEGQADIYPRLSPTSEWDTAAGHAVLLAAGGRVDGPDGGPLTYGKRAFLNRGFCATGGWEAPPIGPFLEPFAGGGEIPAGV